jgi:polyhydroxyalkanoate synthesis regulator phasin
MLAHLHAVVSHMSMVSVAQAKQHQDLSEEVDRLDGEVRRLQAHLQAIARPRLV